MTSSRFDLRGKVAIVTGGNGGIGLGMARGLADAGANIAVVGRNETKSAAAVADLGQRGVKAISVPTDVTDKAAIAAMVDRVVRDLGRIDILINNAGMSIRKPPHELELDEWNTVINTNLTSAFLCSKLAYPALKASGKHHRGAGGRESLRHAEPDAAIAAGDNRDAAGQIEQVHLLS